MISSLVIPLLFSDLLEMILNHSSMWGKGEWGGGRGGEKGGERLVTAGSKDFPQSVTIYGDCKQKMNYAG